MTVTLWTLHLLELSLSANHSSADQKQLNGVCRQLKAHIIAHLLYEAVAATKARATGVASGLITGPACLHPCIL